MNQAPKTSHTARKWERIVVDIPVTVTAVLESGTGSIVDLSEHGMQVRGCTLPKGTQFQAEFEGQTVFGVVAWSEFDRFGARMPFPLHDGPLYDQLKQARMQHEMGRTLQSADMDHLTAPGMPGLRASAGGFGRRRF